VNLANGDGDKRGLAYEGFLEELRRCEQLGIKRHNFQFSTSGLGLTIVQGVRRIERAGSN
jgi:endonuclease IV